MARVLSPSHPDVLARFRRRSPANSAVAGSAPPGSRSAPPDHLIFVDTSHYKRQTSKARSGVSMKSALNTTGKWIFGLTLIPLLIAGTIINMIAIHHFFPDFFEQAASMSHDRSDGVLLAAPLPFALSVLWYKLLAALRWTGSGASQSERPTWRWRIAQVQSNLSRQLQNWGFVALLLLPLFYLSEDIIASEAFPYVAFAYIIAGFIIWVNFAFIKRTFQRSREKRSAEPLHPPT